MTYIHQITFHTENVILYGIFHVMHEMRLLMPITRVLTDSLTPANAKCENLDDLTNWTTLQYLFNFITSYVFLWVANFRGLTACFAHLPTLSRTFIAGYICLTKNKIWVFHHGGGDLPHFASPKHTKFIIIILCIRESQFWTSSHFRAHYTFTKNGE